ncbi:hypothetical protein Back2_17420 [Nocardioides baekrokdamisoli]|uniref:Uncharacterized protein n=2 Tax=Nocardioides baekrokdamisoli TaxID=1804624 RepID=A0A3G9IN51_9ACTN|nr:hypothetical protein Back2_17420 [Nocardioides baekrokdamisoli]
MSEMATWWSVFGVGIGLMALGMVTPRVVAEFGGACVGLAFTWALAARTGGPKLLVSGLAAAVGLVAIASDLDALRTGASITTAVIASILGIVVTRPATNLFGALKETLLALVVPLIGGFAALAFAPRYESFAQYKWGVGGIAAVGLFWLVFRLGAGLHGLGRRGVVIVIGGAFALAMVLAYAEFLRTYGSHDVVNWMQVRTQWMRAHLGAYPRPMMALIGIPALMLGVHMRSRRGQGWWVSAYGVAATATLAATINNPDVGLRESGLELVYSLVVGVLIGVLLIRVDLVLSSVGRRSSGRRVADVDPEAAGVRTEPARTQPLL